MKKHGHGEHKGEPTEEKAPAEPGCGCGCGDGPDGPAVPSTDWAAGKGEYFRAEKQKYGLTKPLDMSFDLLMDNWVGGWRDTTYGPDGDGFSQGEGCEWVDRRVIEFEIHIANRNWDALWTELNAVLRRMYGEVQTDMLRRRCNPPCRSHGPDWRRVSRGIYYQRLAQLRPYPGGERPHDWAPYIHYWDLTFTITWEITRTCSRDIEG